MEKDLKIVFMGTPDFAVPSLKILVEEGFDVVGVITVADKPAGRGRKILQSPVKTYAESQNIPVLQPTNLKDPGFIKELNSLNADLQVVVAFRMLPEMVWNMPRLGTINLHGSLLPQYRGAAPINWAIINGEEETGVTTFFLQHEIDTGRVIQRTTIPIDQDESAGDLHDKMMVIGSKTLLKTVQSIQDGMDEAIEQSEMSSEDQLNAAPKIFKDDCRVDWNQDNETIHNFIRGLSPYPGSWTKLNDIVFKIFKGELSDSKKLDSGTLITDNKSYLKVATKNGLYSVLQIQMQGKRKMKIDEFLRGYNFPDSSKFE